MEHEQAFKKLLFLTDGSPPALSAQEIVILLAKKLDTEVTIFHVVTHELMRPRFQDFLVQGRSIPESADISPGVELESEISWAREGPTSSGAHYSERIAKELTDVYRQQGEEIVADVALAFKEEGIRAERKLVEHRHAAEAIIEEAEREDYDLIVMGRNGRKEKEARLGRVAEKVARHSPVPVLIAGEKRKISKVLVPLDGSKSSEKALECAAALAKKLAASLTLLHVQESHLFGLRPELTKTIGKGIMTSAAEKLKGVGFDQRLESGDPARKITEIAEKEDYDIIVMGNKGHSGANRFLLGSVTNHVLHYTSGPVLIVK